MASGVGRRSKGSSRADDLQINPSQALAIIGSSIGIAIVIHGAGQKRRARRLDACGGGIEVAKQRQSKGIAESAGNIVSQRAGSECRIKRVDRADKRPSCPWLGN